MTDDIQSMEVSGYLCTLTSTGLVGIESSRNIYVPTIRTHTYIHTIFLPLIDSYINSYVKNGYVANGYVCTILYIHTGIIYVTYIKAETASTGH